MIRQRVARATVTVDLSAVAENVARLRAVAAPAEVWAVVKANAYGHGAVEVGRAALDAGAAKLCVATWDEARVLREQLADAPVLVMSPLAPGQEEEVEGVEVVVSSVEAYERLRAGARAPLDVHVKVDTGMGRWGIRADDERALRIGEELAGGGLLRLGGLMSHFASADSGGTAFHADADFTEQQARRFGELADRFPPGPRHIANSAAALRLADTRWDAVRCGIAVLGMSPFATSPADDGLRPALAFRSYVADVKRLRTGESSGYGRRFRARRPTWIGLVPTGYADGVPRLLSGRADVLVRGRRRRVAATVSMDQLTFVIGTGATSDVEVGDPVTLLGRDGDESVTAEEWGAWAETINYEIATGLEPRPCRVDRVFTGA
jgi:alanine racemase